MKILIAAFCVLYLLDRKTVVSASGITLCEYVSYLVNEPSEDDVYAGALVYERLYVQCVLGSGY